MKSKTIVSASESQKDVKLEEIKPEVSEPVVKPKRKNRKRLEQKIFYMPQAYYEEIKNEIDEMSKKKIMKTKFSLSRLKCHSSKNQNFTNTRCSGMSPGYIFEAVKQAYENRDFPAVYKLIEIGFTIDMRAISNHLVEYLLLTIKIDPAIPNREEFFMDVVKGLTGTSEDISAPEFIKRFHLLEKNINKRKKIDDSSSDSDNKTKSSKRN